MLDQPYVAPLADALQAAIWLKDNSEFTTFIWLKDTTFKAARMMKVIMRRILLFDDIGKHFLQNTSRWLFRQGFRGRRFFQVPTTFSPSSTSPRINAPAPTRPAPTFRLLPTVEFTLKKQDAPMLQKPEITKQCSPSFTLRQTKAWGLTYEAGL